MNKNYIVLTVIALFLGGGLMVIPSQKNKKELPPELLLEELMDDSRFISTDDLARKIINRDPSIQLIDVRTEDEYKKYHLPGAFNVPLDSILTENNQIFFDQIVRKSILYSNGTIYASQAWGLLKRNNYPNLLILDGGLNNWAATILQPTQPKETDSDEEWARYQFRLGASKFFTGSSEVMSAPKQAKKPIQRRKKKGVYGGC